MSNTETLFEIRVDGKQIGIFGATDTADTLAAVLGVTDPTSDLVGEYYGQLGSKDVDVEVRVYA